MIPRQTRAPKLLRRLAALLLHGPDGPFVLGDLDEAYEGDLRRGVSPRGAARRYVTNASAPALALAWIRIRDGDLGISWLDLKLGVRMLRRQPGLAAVAVFALAVAIPASMIPSHLARAFLVTLSFDEGERIVGVPTSSWASAEGGPE